MKTVRFVSKDKRQLAATLKKKVNDYFKEKGISTKGNARMVIKSLVMISMFLAPFVVLLTVPLPGWTIFPLAVMIGIGMAGIGMSVMHDAAHGSFSKWNWLNKLFGSSMYMLGGNVFTWKVQHNVLHHTFTNISGMDEDIDSKGIFRFSKETPVKKAHRFQHIYAFFFYSLMSLSKLFRDFFQLHIYYRAGHVRNQKSTLTKEYTKMIISKLVYLFVAIGLPLLLTSFSWWLIVLGFVIVHLTAGLIMSVVFQLAHVVEGLEQPVPNAEGNIENEWVIHELLTTSNFARKNRFITWLVGGLNFQIEHHLFPNICHVHYKHISPIVEQTVREFGVPYHSQPTFRGAVLSHLRVLKALGREK